GGRGALVPIHVGDSGEDSVDVWERERASRASAPVSAQYVNEEIYGLEDLDEQWVQSPQYGNVWVPSQEIVGSDFTPYYSGGRWSYTDYGWTWVSEYNWGWAPFHYGNWCNAPGYGWCWAPGSTWGPSWVTFRYSTGFCGWAPLPPGCGWRSGVGLTWAGAGIGVGFNFGYSAGNYCWTPTSYFAHPNCWNYGVGGKRVEQLYKDSTVINNYIVGNNNTIINNGIDPANIQKHSRSEIRKVQLADAPSSTAAGGLAAATARPDQTGRLPVYRPTVSASGGSAAPANNVRSEARPTQLASQTRTAPDRFSLPTRPTTSRSFDGSAPTRINLPAGSPNPAGSAVALHNNRPVPGASSGTVASLPGRGSVPTSSVRGPQSSSSPVVVPSRSNPSPSRNAYTPNAPSTAAQRPLTGVPSRTEPRKTISSNPTPAPYQQAQPGNNRVAPQPSRGNVRPNYSAPTPSRGAGPSYQAPSFSRPQSAPIPQAGSGRSSFSSGSSFNSAPRSAPSGGGGSGGSMARPGGRQSP
ncbi:MAG TPA: hypothetical protein DCE44_06745, partial [Verrucomicrobiales bacterium]|nr:hypothetical protein [Verrucomicrobiales bacterium]